MINTKGVLTTLGDPMEFDAAERPPGLADAGFSGANIAMQLNIRVQNFGTSYLCIYLDGEEIAQTPFTLRRQQPSIAQGGPKSLK